MKLVHTAKLSVFAHPGEDPVLIKSRLESLVPFDMKKEKLHTEHQKATGLQGNIIDIFTITLTKSGHTNKFLESLFHGLGTTQKSFIEKTLESRLDSGLDFFIRLDKSELLQNNRFVLTDSGNCFHIRLTIAAFPKKRGAAIETVKRILDKY